MAKYIDAENDYLYIQGQENIVSNLLKKLNFTLEQIADMAGVSVEFVKNVKQKLTLDN